MDLANMFMIFPAVPKDQILNGKSLDGKTRKSPPPLLGSQEGVFRAIRQALEGDSRLWAAWGWILHVSLDYGVWVWRFFSVVPVQYGDPGADRNATGAFSPRIEPQNPPGVRSSEAAIRRLYMAIRMQLVMASSGLCTVLPPAKSSVPRWHGYGAHIIAAITVV
ncbi:hypothetical protein BD779DRAFT_1469004 [Infundibulicybe gibba]|nr:hypothetical protein BD779DRAFT_1469004 [Infundibulicybe gibba]